MPILVLKFLWSSSSSETLLQSSADITFESKALNRPNLCGQDTVVVTMFNTKAEAGGRATDGT